MSALVATCKLTADAQRRRTADGHCLLLLEVALPHGSRGKPIQANAMRDYGTSASADIACASMAHHLRAGAHVTLHLAGIGWRRGRAMLDIEGLQTDTARHWASPDD
jgi:hypothetical protein